MTYFNNTDEGVGHVETNFDKVVFADEIWQSDVSGTIRRALRAN